VYVATWLWVEYMLVLIRRCMINVEALGDGVDRDLGFWLHDGGSARKFHSTF
jgi:hypothetical protein